MNALRQAARRSLWVGVGVAAILAAGCAGIPGRDRDSLTGNQEVPPVTTSASGIADITVAMSRCPNSSSNCPQVHGYVTTTGITATAAHIHMAAAGQNGPVVVALVKANENTWVVPGNAFISDAQYAAYGAGLFYVNVHSDANKAGEIRGQIKPL
jgi:CHRD domain-containing protein